ncbi:MAG TPA: DUF3108 domain-containing protein [Verrucomicrobiae bacterium]|nr:DUF3108 domain-containing protein [Verrucomicrobiae bacterium]
MIFLRARPRLSSQFGIVAIAIIAAGLWLGLELWPSSGAAFAAAGGSQSARRRTSKPKHAPEKANEPAMPFRVGEILSYRVAWAGFSNAASLQLSVPERRDLYGFQTWHFRVVTHTVSPVRRLFALDDQFDSYTDAATLESRQFETHLSEMGKIDDQVLHFSASGQPPHSPGPVVVVSPGTRDPLGVLYALRAQNWQHAPDLRTPVYDGRDLFDMRARCEALSEPVKVAAGNFSAARIAIHVFQYEKELSSIRFEIWIANDPARTPVVIEANLPFGSVRAELLTMPK